jgi:uncharacterized membrane protein
MPCVAVASISRWVARHPGKDATGAEEVAEERPTAGPAVALAGLVALYVWVFGRLTWRQHGRWRSLGFDTGIYDQGMWLLAHGRDPFLTMRGMDYWGHHVAPIGYLFAPIYWLGGGVQAVSLVHTAWVAVGAVPLWLLARDRWGRRWEALAVPVAYLVHPAVQWVTWWLFHPDSLAITPLLFAWWLARAGRWRWFAVAIAVAMACKEDVALAVVVLGVVIAVRSPPGKRRAGGITALAGAAWFLLCSKVVIPLRNDHAPPFYESYFPSLGASLGEILRNVVLHPTRPARLLARPRNPDYALKMLGPLGFVLPLLGPAALLVAGPQLGVNLLVEVQDGATIKSQYASLPLVGLFLGLVEGLALLRRRPVLLRAAAAWLVACALVGSHLWGLGPYSRDYRSGVWSDRPRPNVAELERAHALVPPRAGVAVSWNVVTHFTHRQIVYEYPNPWLSSNYGPSGNEVGDPTTVSWIVVERSALGAREIDLLARLVGPGGGFVVVQEGNGVTVARRAPAAAAGSPVGSLVPP